MLAVCLIVAGVVLLIASGGLVFIVESVAGLAGSGNPSPEGMAWSAQQDARALWFAGAVGFVGAALVAGGVWRLMRKR
ncbi:MAG TPA: hypothetical protein VHC70_02875 [Phycisphaerales bacterium]|nr:hypothetical protein [Phycisphaerales bacterium]